jgi:prepilin-type N-terminal cleavage/methylation domain-containing protein
MKKGFTLVEILILVTIILILAAIAVPYLIHPIIRGNGIIVLFVSGFALAGVVGWAIGYYQGKFTR